MFRFRRGQAFRQANESAGDVMDERTFEIVLSRYPEGLLPDGWELEGQQIGVAGGTLDLLFRDQTGVRHLVELKKGPATLQAAHQVLRYMRALASTYGNQSVPWVIAHTVSTAVAVSARAVGVQTLGISTATCEAVLAARGVQIGHLVPMRRRTPGALTGGAGDVWAAVANTDALADMPGGMSTAPDEAWNGFGVCAQFGPQANDHSIPRR
jgi:hypothetical protein